MKRGRNILERFANYLSERYSSVFRESAAKVEELETALRNAEEEKTQSIQKARQIVDEVHQIANRRVAEALIGSRYLRAGDFKKLKIRPELINSYRRAKDEVERQRESIETLEEKVKEAEGRCVINSLAVLASTNQFESLPFAIFTPDGNELRKTEMFDRTLKKYAPNEAFAPYNELTNPNFLEELEQNKRVARRYGNVRATFLNLRYSGETTPVLIPVILKPLRKKTEIGRKRAKEAETKIKEVWQAYLQVAIQPID